jgi:hypothetical protein
VTAGVARKVAVTQRPVLGLACVYPLWISGAQARHAPDPRGASIDVRPSLFYHAHAMRV